MIIPVDEQAGLVENGALYLTKFKAVAQAYEVLSDDDKRRKYDAGEDVTENPGEGEQGGGPGQGHWMHHGGQHVHVHFR